MTLDNQPNPEVNMRKCLLFPVYISSVALVLHFNLIICELLTTCVYFLYSVLPYSVLKDNNNYYYLYYKNRKRLCHGHHAICDRRYFLEPYDNRPPAMPARIPIGDTLCGYTAQQSRFPAPCSRRMRCAELLRLTPQVTILCLVYGRPM